MDLNTLLDQVTEGVNVDAREMKRAELDARMAARKVQMSDVEFLARLHAIEDANGGVIPLTVTKRTSEPVTQVEIVLPKPILPDMPEPLAKLVQAYMDGKFSYHQLAATAAVLGYSDELAKIDAESPEDEKRRIKDQERLTRPENGPIKSVCARCRLLMHFWQPRIHCYDCENRIRLGLPFPTYRGDRELTSKNLPEHMKNGSTEGTQAWTAYRDNKEQHGWKKGKGKGLSSDTKASEIRRLAAAGMTVNEIKEALGLRYQHVYYTLHKGESKGQSVGPKVNNPRPEGGETKAATIRRMHAANMTIKEIREATGFPYQQVYNTINK